MLFQISSCVAGVRSRAKMKITNVKTERKPSLLSGSGSPSREVVRAAESFEEFESQIRSCL